MKPYSSDTPNDWMNVTAAEWMDRYMPAGWRDRSYADLMRASPTEWLGWMYPQYAGAAGAAGAPASARHPVYDVPRHGRPHPHGCRCRECEGCRRCGRDACECTCCIGDVDLVVYARVGEQRVIPLVIENERRREKAITAELGPWRTRGGGDAPVDTIGVEPTQFTLPPCGEKEIVIAVRVRGSQRGGNEGGDQTGVRQPQDVDGCLVVTSDLTLNGCDHRPIRIAIAILPRDCDPFRIECGCGCC